MGGLGSGKGLRRKRRKKLLTTSLPALNFSDLAKLHNQNPEGVFSWRDYKLTVKDARVYMERQDGGQVFEIELVSMPCHYGGFRYFARCRYCERRTKTLYLCDKVMACRRCLRMAYPTQNTTLEMRLHWKQSKLEKKIGRGWDKPKWMRWPTFRRLRGERFDLEEKQDIAGFFALRNMQELNRKYEECPCAIIAIETALLKALGSKYYLK